MSWLPLLGIPIVVLGSQIIMGLIKRFPILIIASPDFSDAETDQAELGRRGSGGGAVHARH